MRVDITLLYSILHAEIVNSCLHICFWYYEFVARSCCFSRFKYVGGGAGGGNCLSNWNKNRAGGGEVLLMEQVVVGRPPCCSLGDLNQLWVAIVPEERKREGESVTFFFLSINTQARECGFWVLSLRKTRPFGTRMQCVQSVSCFGFDERGLIPGPGLRSYRSCS